MSNQIYSEDFYNYQKGGSLSSAQVMVPLVLSYVRPQSVVDVGCGVGTWLSVFRESGVEDILGVDGDHVDPGMLQIPAENFLPRDLKAPVPAGRRFDLAMSLEVAEHLPGECAESFIKSLVSLSPIVLFSAAIPNQGGVGHINEQWPEYWAEIFKAQGYVAVDCLRRKVWQNPLVRWWYAQNTFFFVDRSKLDDYPLLKTEYTREGSFPLSLVHPDNFSEKSISEEGCRKWAESLSDPTNKSLKEVLSWLPGLAMRAVKNKASNRLGHSTNSHSPQSN
jgi:hypothetical protein